MVTTPRADVAELLDSVPTGGAFSVRRIAPPDDLRLDVRGIGPLRLPVTAAQARELRAVARRAPYGRGEETLTDRSVRDTWQIPKARVTIDQRRWNAILRPMLEQIRGDLGLPDSSRLKAVLHSVLLYEPGQFFVPHQDSEKSDDMVGTLVVMLPARSHGGALVVSHGNERVSYRSSPTQLTFVAFYSDCHHEVRPLVSGNRVVLTYNLLLRGSGGASPAPAAPDGFLDELRQCLAAYFVAASSTDTRLVYLLDHQYTARSLSWGRLKGVDTSRAAVLRAAADRADCVATLALAEVHETWSAYEEGDSYGYRWDSRPWDGDESEYDDDTDYDAADLASTDRDGHKRNGHNLDGYDLNELIEGSTVLTGWLRASGSGAEPIASRVYDDELCSSTPSSELSPTQSEYEGYMGNYGNTLDRWYHRGAVVLWPRQYDFAVRSAASPFWAMDRLAERAGGGELAQARQLAATLEPFWADTVTSVTSGDFSGSMHRHSTDAALFGRALAASAALDDADLARMMLGPFHLQALAPEHATALLTLAPRHLGTLIELIVAWAANGGFVGERWGGGSLAWVTTLPELCAAIRAANPAQAAGDLHDEDGPEAGNATEPHTSVIEQLVSIAWGWIVGRVEAARATTAPSRRSTALAELAAPVAACLHAMGLVGTSEFAEQAATSLSGSDDAALPLMIAVLRALADQPAEVRQAAGYRDVAHRAETSLGARLSGPERAADDWSIASPGGCDCELCETLAAFLADPAKQRFEWPIAQAKRRHIHARIDQYELPVRHETRRRGSPYTLVLTKLNELFGREKRAHEKNVADLAWLRAHMT